ncbi:transcriptional regulator, GntR family with aminotransferase domain containing protein [Clostridium sp. DL-VIII]|uniref:MocR-like pyridoxine biosynthesis transcription factor PdxR n=1 Tax=Clostridium sp. DL-VIII TaxID=641107 RepID=UPI00023AFBF4|nr:PLP-dependent aminotransferase family protein [Clostridium sp. DL-VIII]EHI98289.1 transcriptional regulator, GntR family with aminotransferase domain containing protein [Clostridium sp. DL-VIII]
MLELLPNFNSDSKIPLYIQIYNYIKNEILSGNIPHNSKLPSIRSFAKDLMLSKNTIEAAYEQLLAEGYVKSKNRSGLYVTRIESGFKNINENLQSSSISMEKPTDCNIKVRYDFSSGQIDLTTFPYSQFRKIVGRSIDEFSSELLLYGDHQGDYGLRHEIAKYIHHSRGVVCSPEQIVISSGTQQSLTLLCHMLLHNHKNAAFEEPSYLGAKAVFKHFNFDISPIKLDMDGINIEALYKCLAKIVYVTPSHQYPYGMVMSISKRLRLLKWADENNGIIIEDDYDGEFRFKGKPIPSLQGLDNSNRVIYLGSFSKSLMPSMRISYLVLPKSFLNIYEKNYKIYEQPVSRLLQKSLEIFIKEGYWEKHLRKAKILYKKKQELLLNSLAEYFKENITIIGADSGLHILLQIHTKMDEQELIEIALKAGIKVDSTSVNWMNPQANSFPVIFIGFAGIKIEDIPYAVKILSNCWFKT